MYRLAQKNGFILVLVLLLLNQGVRHVRTHTQNFLKIHLQVQGIEESQIGDSFVLSHGNLQQEADIILPDLFDELYSWTFQIDDLSDDQHWMLLDLSIVQSEEDEAIEVAQLGKAIISVWQEHEYGVNRVVAHGTSAILAVEAVEQNPEFIKELVLINPIFPGFFPDVNQILPENSEGMAERFEVFSGVSLSNVPGPLLSTWVEHYQQSTYQALVTSLESHRLDHQVRDCAVHIIWSTPNPYAVDGLKQHVQTHFPNAKWSDLVGCGFAPHYLCTEELGVLLNQ